MTFTYRRGAGDTAATETLSVPAPLRPY